MYVICIVQICRVKPYSQESVDNSDLVISNNVSSKIFNKNENDRFLAKFHEFIIG